MNAASAIAVALVTLSVVGWSAQTAPAPAVAMSAVTAERGLRSRCTAEPTIAVLPDTGTEPGIADLLVTPLVKSTGTQTVVERRGLANLTD